MDHSLEALQEELGVYGKTLTLPFASDGVPSLLYALREKRWLRSNNDIFRVVAATYDKHTDEVTFLFDYSTPPADLHEDVSAVPGTW